MSYDLAAWYDPDGRLRGREEDHYAALAEEPEGEPDEHVAAFVDELSRRWPWVEDDPADDAPWATWPLESQAAAGGVVLNIRYSQAAVATEIVKVAHAHGLTVYDPQAETVTPPKRPRRFWRR